MSNRIDTLPLRVVLTVPFVILILVTGSLIGYLTFQNSQRAVNALAGQLHTAVTDRIQERLDGYLATPHLINQLNLDGVRLEQLRLQDLDRLGQHFITQIQRFDSVVSIAYANEQAEYTGATQKINGLTLSFSRQSTNSELTTYRSNAQGNQLELIDLSIPNYDPRSRPWYRSAVQASTPIWTPVYLWSSGYVGLDAVTPVYTKDGKLTGVLDTSLILTGIGDFLQSLRVVQHGQTFIIERSGLLVAASAVKEPYTRLGDQLQRLAALDSTEPMVRTAAQQLVQQFGAVANITTSQPFYFDLAGEQYFAHVTPYGDTYGLDWLIVVVIPESDFMAQIYTNNRNTALLVLVSLLISIGIATLLARRVTQPILRLNQSARTLAHGDWTHKVVIDRRDEVGELARAFNHMAEQLQASFASLHASEARYRSLFEGVPVGIYRSSPEGRLLDVNPALITMFGYPDRATALTMNAADFYTNAMQRTHWQAELERADGSSSVEVQLYTYQRTLIWVQNNARIARNADGNVLYYEGSLEDITARKQAEQERSRLLHALHERVKELTALHHAARILQQGGMGRPALLHHLAALLPPAFQYPESTAACVRLGDQVATTPGFADALPQLCTNFTIADGAHGSIAVAYTTKQPAEIEGPFLAEERQLIESLADMLRTASDRTQAEAALRDSEVRFRAIFEQAAIGIGLVDMQGRSITANPALTTMLGYSANELHNIPFTTFTHPDDVDSDVALFSELIAGTREFYAMQKRYIRKDGQVVWGNLRVSLIRDASGAPQFAIGMAEDVTERKRIEQQYLQAQKLDSIGRLAGGIAHDFNNLLTVILGNTDMLLQEVGSDHPFQHDIAQIRDAARRAAALTRQLLAFSRKQVLVPSVIDLNAVVAGIAPLLTRLIGEHITLSTNLAPDLGRVLADPGQLEQVIVNLVVNARDAMPEGGTLILETANAELDAPVPGVYVLLAVSDTGIGMDAATRERIFEPFFTTKELGKGTGLGLATVYGIITQSGGHIWVYSEVGQGTTFKAYLPHCDTPQQAIEERMGELGAATAPGDTTILVVEDDAGVRDLTDRLLRGWGHQVLTASDAQDALRVAAESPDPIDLLLTDVIMPGGTNGVALATQLLVAYPRLQVLYMSGYTDMALTSQAVLPSRQALILKPFTAEALARAVRAALSPMDTQPPALQARAAGA
jgi:PAS domain S-box-containing protein